MWINKQVDVKAREENIQRIRTHEFIECLDFLSNMYEIIIWLLVRLYVGYRRARANNVTNYEKRTTHGSVA